MDPLSTTLTDDFLTCTICYEIYTEPKTLPCLHSFCKECVLNFIHMNYSKGPYHCPICRETFVWGLEGLKTNFCLQNMIEMITKASASSKTPCSFCKLMKKDYAAVSQCLTCLDYLCEECTTSRHTFTRQTFNHNVVLLSDVREGRYDNEIRLVQKIYCSRHSTEVLRYYCVQCNITICRDCVICDHRNHEIKPIPDARKERESKISELTKLLMKRVEVLEQNNSDITMRMETLAQRESIVQREIGRTCKEVISSIRETQNRMEKELEARLVSGRERLQNALEKSSKACKDINESIMFSDKMLKNSNDVEVLSFLDEMFERLTKLNNADITQEIVCPAVEIPDFQMKWHEPQYTFTLRKESDSTYCEQEKGDRKENAMIADHETHRQKNCATNLSKSLSLSMPSLNVSTCKNRHKYNLRLLDSFELNESDDKFQPVYSSVAWIDEGNIAVVDKENDKIKRLNLCTGTINSKTINKALSIAVYEKGIVCRSADFCMRAFNKTFEEIKRETGVYTLVVSSPQNPYLMWITKKKIFIEKDGALFRICVRSENIKTALPSVPIFGCYLPDDTYVVSDSGNRCVYVINNRGEIIKKINHFPGSIAYDRSQNIFITDFEGGSISIFDQRKSYLTHLKIGKWDYSPRSISILENRLLITTKHKILLYDLSSM